MEYCIRQMLCCVHVGSICTALHTRPVRPVSDLSFRLALTGSIYVKQIEGVHSLVLHCCALQVENWTDADSRAAKPEMLMQVPAGQLEVGQLLIKAMYQDQPRFLDSSHQQLLQLLLLADRYSLPAVMPAVAAAFKAIPVQQLEWEVALEMLDMPDSCAGQAAFKDIAAIATDRLQQQLLALSEAAMKQLLQHQGTRVASENTVAYTVQKWYEAQNNFSALPAAVRLMRLVRMRYCTPLYIGTVMSSSTVFCSCFSQQDIAIAGLCCTASGYAALTASKCKVLDKYPAWCAEKRPVTAKQQVVKLRLELSKLKGAVEGFLGKAQSTRLDEFLDAHADPYLILQGHTLLLKVQLQSHTSDSPQPSKQATLGLYLGVYDLEGGAVAKVTFHLAVEVGSSGLLHFIVCDAQQPFCAAMNVYGVKDFCGIRAFSSWSSLDATLRNKNLVRSDGCLHFTAFIKEVE